MVAVWGPQCKAGACFYPDRVLFFVCVSVSIMHPLPLSFAFRLVGSRGAMAARVVRVFVLALFFKAGIRGFFLAACWHTGRRLARPIIRKPMGYLAPNPPLAPPPPVRRWVSEPQRPPRGRSWLEGRSVRAMHAPGQAPRPSFPTAVLHSERRCRGGPRGAQLDGHP